MRKNVLFVAKFDNILKGTNAILAKTFNMQMCPPEPEMVKKTFEILEIDLILLYISGVGSKQVMGLCEKLDKVSLKIPIVVFGTPDECKEFENCCVFHLNISKYLYRPITVLEITKELCALLGVESDSPPSPVTMPHMSIADFADSLENDKRRCLLLVDDDGRILRAMKILLEKKYKVNIANSAISALASIEREMPDAVLLDYEMPVCDGKRTLEMLRQDIATQNLPVFFLTGVSDKERVKEILHLKPQGYFLKNSEPDVILGALEKFFQSL